MNGFLSVVRKYTDIPELTESLINSATHLHTSTLPCRRRQILDVATATPAVCLLDRNSVSVQIWATSFYQRFLTSEIVREFIEKVYIFHPEVADGKRTQKIVIVWNCIGAFYTRALYAENEQA